MSDLAGFLLARIAEDEQVARLALAPENMHPWGDLSLPPPHRRAGPGEMAGYLGGAWGDHAARWAMPRVLAECQAKRRVIYAAPAALEGPDGRFWPPRVHMTGLADGLVLAVQMLALPYADHADYRREWAP